MYFFYSSYSITKLRTCYMFGVDWQVYIYKYARAYMKHEKLFTIGNNYAFVI